MQKFYLQLTYQKFIFKTCTIAISLILLAAIDWSNEGTLAASTDIFCLSEFNYETNSRLCVSNREALGPFPSEMIKKCQKFGGGPACEGTKWEVNFAQKLRGKTLCPPGARFDFEISQCTENENAYGPFTEEVVNQCRNSGRDSVCDTMRLSRSIFPKAFNFPIPTDAIRTKKYSLWATNYYAYPGVSVSNGESLLNLAGNPLGPKLSKRDWCLGAIEGTIEFTDQNSAKTTYNFAGEGATRQVNCRPLTGRFPGGRERYKISRGPYGEGVQLLNLVPYRTIAVDKSVITIGSLIYIPAARGVTITLPSSEKVTHDGYFYAADVGSGIRGNHIDVFTGISIDSPFLFTTANPNSKFSAFLIEEPQIRQNLKAMHDFKFR